MFPADDIWILHLGNPQEKNNLVDKSETSTNKKNSDREFLKSNTSIKSNSPTRNTGITGDIASDKLLQSINDFFSNGNGIPSNSLEQSPCCPIIGSRIDEIRGSVDDANGNPIDASYTNTIYYCKLHPDLGNVFLGEIELHCREKEPEIHKAEILKALGLGG